MELDKFAAAHEDAQGGGILLGRRLRLQTKDGNTRVEIMIEKFLPLSQQTSSPRFLIDSEQLNALKKRIETNFSEYSIVGWIHVRPGFGVFISSLDKQLHTNYFTDEELIYVLDPVNRGRGFFVLQNEDWIQLEGFYIQETPTKKKTNRLGNRKLSVALGIFFVLISIIGTLWLYDLGPFKEESPLEVIAEESSEEEETWDFFRDLDYVVSHDTAREYIVQAGDTLWKIAEENLGDPTRFPEIMDLNNLKRSEPIHPGQRILLPKD